MTLSDDYSSYDVIKVAVTSGTGSSFVELVAPLQTNTNYSLLVNGGMAWVTFRGPREMYMSVSGSFFVIGYKYQTA